MRAYKTVNDSYIEPISFTVPRRAETFQSDIFPPAVGNKPAMSASEWLSGKDGLPPKIDLESIYEGNAPVEVSADYKPPAAATIDQPKPAAAAPKKAESEAAAAPKSAPVAARAPPQVSDQKASISAMANKYQDNEESSDDDDETSSFEEITKPVIRAASAVQAKAASVLPSIQDIKAAVPSTVKSPVTPAVIKPKSPEPTPAPTPAAAPQPKATPSVSQAAPATGSSLESSLQHITRLLEKQTAIISEQTDKIGQLTAEVEVLKKRVGTGSAAAQDQSERIRQLELELEAARS